MHLREYIHGWECPVVTRRERPRPARVCKRLFCPKLTAHVHPSAGLTFYLYNEVSTLALKKISGVTHRSMAEGTPLAVPSCCAAASGRACRLWATGHWVTRHSQGKDRRTSHCLGCSSPPPRPIPPAFFTQALGRQHGQARHHHRRLRHRLRREHGAPQDDRLLSGHRRHRRRF